MGESELAIDTYISSARREYANAFEQRQHALEACCHRYGFHLLPLSTEDDPISALQTALGKRSR
jgi:hypothetical protein